MTDSSFERENRSSINRFRYFNASFQTTERRRETTPKSSKFPVPEFTAELNYRKPSRQHNHNVYLESLLTPLRQNTRQAAYSRDVRGASALPKVQTPTTRFENPNLRRKNLGSTIQVSPQSPNSSLNNQRVRKTRPISGCHNSMAFYKVDYRPSTPQKPTPKAVKTPNSQLTNSSLLDKSSLSIGSSSTSRSRSPDKRQIGQKAKRMSASKDSLSFYTVKTQKLTTKPSTPKPFHSRQLSNASVGFSQKSTQTLLITQMSTGDFGNNSDSESPLKVRRSILKRRDSSLSNVLEPQSSPPRRVQFRIF